MSKLKINIRSAIKLDQKSLASLSQFINKQHQVEPELTVTVDRSLVAGFKFMVQGIEYDYSISGSLARLQQEL